MPLTKDTTSSFSYLRVSSTASLMAALMGASSIYSASYIQTSIMATAILAMRLRLQPTEYFVI